jgi:hypothetical protein
MLFQVSGLQSFIFHLQSYQSTMNHTVNTLLRGGAFLASLTILGFLVGHFGYWWGVAIVAAILSFLFQLNPLTSFGIGFSSVSLMWATYATVLNMINKGEMAAKIGALIGGLPTLQLIVITAGIGGILGGLGALTGSFGRDLFAQQVVVTEKN